MHRLQQFAVGTISPEVERLGPRPTTENDPSVAMANFSIIESFLWLHLGVEVGAFPLPASEDVYRAYYLPFFESLSGASSFQSIALYLALPEFARTLIGKAMRQEMPFQDELCGVGGKEGLVGPFQALLILYSRLCRDAAARRFTFAMNFESPDDWQEHWAVNCTTQELLDSVDSEEGSPAVALILVGYMTLCQYARNVKEVLDNIETLEFLDQAKLKGRIREMHAWRINLSSGDTARRFDQVQTRTNDMIKHELESLKLEERVNQVQQSFGDALEFLFDVAPVGAR